MWCSKDCIQIQLKNIGQLYRMWCSKGCIQIQLKNMGKYTECGVAKDAKDAFKYSKRIWGKCTECGAVKETFKQR